MDPELRPKILVKPDDEKEDVMLARLYRSNLEGSAVGNRTALEFARPFTRLTWCLIPLLTLHLSACYTLRPTASDHEIDIQFVNGDGQEPLIEPASGWPLTLVLTANEERLLGIGPCFRKQYPTLGSTAYLVFEDPDDCLPWNPRCPTLPAKAHIEFSPGFHQPKGKNCSGQPTIKTFNPISRTNSQDTPIGPCVAAAPNLGLPSKYGSWRRGEIYGYGANPRLPSLMVIADAGPSVVTEDGLGPAAPPQARNLAGLFQSVAYELKDSRGRTSIRAHMVVPESLVSPVVLADMRVGDRCGDGALARVDGGPAECLNHRDRKTVTIRAFVVAGRAPNVLPDANGDGVVDISDARRVGLRLLSEQVSLRVTQPRLLSSRIFFYDLDDKNGETGSAGSHGGRVDPGAIEDPPR